ncbi:hypothetical protein B0J17DRAFT_706347 [Rhizoctonia solani]|nr:hypothetical protein B0J17DRAFT_706347 [Rhizoctonia solani]
MPPWVPITHLVVPNQWLHANEVDRYWQVSRGALEAPNSAKPEISPETRLVSSAYAPRLGLSQVVSSLSGEVTRAPRAMWEAGRRGRIIERENWVMNAILGLKRKASCGIPGTIIREDTLTCIPDPSFCSTRKLRRVVDWIWHTHVQQNSLDSSTWELPGTGLLYEEDQRIAHDKHWQAENQKSYSNEVLRICHRRQLNSVLKIDPVLAFIKHTECGSMAVTQRSGPGITYVRIAFGRGKSGIRGII